jgi:cardiolipin synthase A/B
VFFSVGDTLMTRQNDVVALEPQSHVPAATTGSYPVRPGNRVRPLVDGIPTFRRIAEAIKAARQSIWVAVTFYGADFQFPDGEGSVFDMLDRAVARGLDVRLLFWRPNPESSGYGRTFPGLAADRDLLRARGSRFSIRWDRADTVFCQHQKAWLIDAGEASETAFIGGMNLTPMALASPGHCDSDAWHDLYVEVTGPSATDVHHNFVQRWNEASERNASDGVWGDHGTATLAFPSRVSPPHGDSVVQIQRMIHPGRYRDGHAAPGGRPYEIAAGERSILEQYSRAIETARSSIYIENQALPIPEIAVLLEAALQRGVEVVMLVPARPEGYVRAARLDPSRKNLFDRIEALGHYENFALAGIAAPDGHDRRRPIYIHAKVMLVDDVFATIGSCNLHAFSLAGHSEMNAAIWDPGVVRALRCQLLAEHLDQDTTDLEDRAALRLYRQVAGRNRLGMDRADFVWQGLAFALSPADYGKQGA